MKRLTPATLTMVMFGILGLLVVGYVAKNLLAVPEKKVVAAMRDIPMAITDVAPGTILTDKHLGLGKIPVSDLTREMLLTNRVIVGRVVRTPLKAAEPIKANQLYQHGERPPLVLANGMRAVTVQVADGASMVDGMIKPGDHVDVLFTATGGPGVSDLGGLTMRLFEGVKILAINGSSTQSGVDRGSNNVTLELSEPQSNIVVLAHDKGKITLTLNPGGKGDGGVSLSNTERITFNEILGLQRGDAAKPPFMTEIFRGPVRTMSYYDDKGRYIGSRAPNPGPAPPFVLPPTPGPASGAYPNSAPAPSPGPAPGTPTPTTALPAQPQDNLDQPRPAPTASLPQNLPN